MLTSKNISNSFTNLKFGKKKNKKSQEKKEKNSLVGDAWRILCSVNSTSWDEIKSFPEHKKASWSHCRHKLQEITAQVQCAQKWDLIIFLHPHHTKTWRIIIHHCNILRVIYIPAVIQTQLLKESNPLIHPPTIIKLLCDLHHACNYVYEYMKKFKITIMFLSIIHWSLKILSNAWNELIVWPTLNKM